MLSVIRSVLFITAAAVAIGPAGIFQQGPATQAHQAYNEHQKEFYLTADEAGYIRPGFNITVNSVTIGADGTVQTTVTFKDDKNQPLDRAGMVTPGPLSVSFILAWYDGTARQYTAYTTRKQTSPITGDSCNQAGTDSGGTWVDLAMGQAQYTFKTKVPAGYDGSKTHTLVAYGTRNLTDILGKNYIANTEYDFRPDGGAVTETWNAVANATCNQCHTDLGAHGGSRKDIKLCVTCHQPQTWDPDTGNTVDMKVMIHKIHDGANLPSVKAGTPYIIIGHSQTVVDFSNVVLPQDIRNCTTCHKADSPEGDIWMTRPNRAACGSCHDDVNWTTGENHPAGPEADDSACADCHAPQGESEFDASIKGAHTIPVKSAQLKGLHAEILNVTGAVAGGFPTVTFRITENDGTAVNPASLNRCRIQVAGPTVDYTGRVQQDAAAAVFDGDKATIVFTSALPEIEGSFGFSMDAYRNVTIDNHTEAGLSVRECADNPFYYVAADGGTAMPRRDVVSTAKCNVCHDQIAFHGGQRRETQECVICHMPGATADRTDEDTTQINYGFKWMIHRIHTGEELRVPYEFGGNTLSEFAFPGDRRACEICHIAGTYGIPLPEGVLPTPDEGEFYTPILPTAAACLACHSSMEAAGHAYTMTAPFGEACEVCHGADAEFSVAKVHAR